jgi:hypothetical protein
VVSHDTPYYQSKLPPGAVPMCLSLYANKNKLSTMGTKKGYLVYVRCANLPAHLCNGEGLAGGRIVGWLPVVRLLSHTIEQLVFLMSC